MKTTMKKTYICPETSYSEYISPILDGTATSLPQVDDEIDDEDDELSKGRKNNDDNWGNLW